jgi:hypothetical protein
MEASADQPATSLLGMATHAESDEQLDVERPHLVKVVNLKAAGGSALLTFVIVACASVGACALPR